MVVVVQTDMIHCVNSPNSPREFFNHVPNASNLIDFVLQINYDVKANPEVIMIALGVHKHHAPIAEPWCLARASWFFLMHLKIKAFSFSAFLF